METSTITPRLVRLLNAFRSRLHLLRRSHAHPGALVHHARDLIYTLSLSGEMTSLNPVVEELTGWQLTELLGKNFADYIHPDDLPIAYDAFQITLIGQTPPPVELRMRCKDGRYLWAEFYGTPIKQGGRLVEAVGVARVIEERKRLEAALRHSEERYRTLIKHFPAGLVAMVDTDMRYQIIDGPILHSLGYSVEQFIGQRVQDTGPADSEIEVESRFEEALRGKSVSFEEIYQGRYYQVDMAPVRSDDQAVDGVITVVQDISERRLADARFRAIFEHSPDAILIIDPVTTHIVDCNNVACQMNGYERHELIGQPIALLNTATIDSPEQYLADIRAKGWLAYETLHRRKDGSIFPVEVKTTLIRLGGQELLLGIDRDISDRRLAEAALRYSENLFRLTFDQSPIGAAIVGLDYYLLRVNDALCRFTGYTAAELLSHTFADLTHPDDVKLDVALTKQLVSGEIDHFHMDKRYIHKSGQVVWGHLSARILRDERGEPLVFLGMVEDITERKQAEVALQHSEQRYRTLVNNFPNGMVALFDRDLRYIVAGGQGIDAMGLSPEMFEGRRLRDIFPPEVYERDEAALLAALRGETTVSEVEFGDRSFIVHTVPVQGTGEEIVGGMVMTQDITAMRQAERQRLALALEHDRMETVNRFVQAISHEFRTTLSLIETGRYLLERGLPDTVRQSVQAKLDAMREHVLRMGQQLDHLSLATSLMNLNREVCDIHMLVESLVTEHQPAADRKRQRLLYRPAPHLPPVYGDSEALRLALRHLVTNALTYTPEEGTIRLCTHADDQHIQVTIEDTGIGIQPEHLRHIFDLFFRADPARAFDAGGIGIGLSLAQIIIEAHQGRITVESTPHVGSRFRVLLPVQHQPQPG